MEKSKKMAALILATMLAVSSSSAMAVTVLAEEDTAVAYSSSDTENWDAYDYRVLDDGTIEIIYYYGCDEVIIIPSEIDGRKVTGIKGFNLSNNENLKSITIPDSVTSIGDSAFSGCRSLTDITIPDSVTSIGCEAFYNCSSLTNITIPDGVTSIGDGTFYDCSSLTNITIPDSVTSIGCEAFYNCSSLTNITIPDGVTSIESETFYNCQSLSNIDISNSLISIGMDAFAHCKNLKNIKIPDSVTTIELGAFNDTLWYNNQPDGLLYAGKVLYLYKGEMPENTKITLKNDTSGIADNAFSYCTNLTNIKIPDSVTIIGAWAFFSCPNLTAIEIPSSVIGIGVYALLGCENLTIYGNIGSYAESYANINVIPFVDINKKITTLTSKVDNISVKGTFDDGVILNVEKATVKNAVAAYDITLKDENGNTIQPNGTITVSIPSDKANCKVYLIKEDGTKVDMNATYNNGNYEFTTDHLSIYALIADTSEPSNESSNEPSNESSNEPSNEPSNESSNEQSNTISDSSKSNSDTNNTDSSKIPSETGKNGVETGDSNNLFAMAAMLTGAITAISTIIFKKKRT